MTSLCDIANAQFAAYNVRVLSAFMALFADDAWLENLPTGQRRVRFGSSEVDQIRHSVPNAGA